MGVRNNDDIVISCNSACVCIRVSGSDSRADAEGQDELEIFADLVSSRCGIAHMRDLSADDPLLHTTVRRVFGDECGVLCRRVLPCPDRAFADINRIRTDREDPEARTVAGDSGETYKRFGRGA